MEQYQGNKEFIDKLKNYNDLDVISLGLILRTLTSSIQKIVPKYDVQKIYQCVSIAHFTFKYYSECIKKDKIVVPKMKKEKEEKITGKGKGKKVERLEEVVK